MGEDRAFSGGVDASDLDLGGLLAHTNRFLADPQPLGNRASAPPPDPKLYATYDGSRGDPASVSVGTEKGVFGRVKDALDPDKP